MSFWENNKGAIKSGSVSALKAVGRGTVAVSKAGYHAAKGHSSNKHGSSEGQTDGDENGAGTAANVQANYMDPRSFPPPPQHGTIEREPNAYPGASNQMQNGYQQQPPLPQQVSNPNVYNPQQQQQQPYGYQQQQQQQPYGYQQQPPLPQQTSNPNIYNPQQVAQPPQAYGYQQQPIQLSSLPQQAQNPNIYNPQQQPQSIPQQGIPPPQAYGQTVAQAYQTPLPASQSQPYNQAPPVASNLNTSAPPVIPQREVPGVPTQNSILNYNNPYHQQPPQQSAFEPQQSFGQPPAAQAFNDLQRPAPVVPPQPPLYQQQPNPQPPIAQNYPQPTNQTPPSLPQPQSYGQQSGYPQQFTPPASNYGQQSVPLSSDENDSKSSVNESIAQKQAGLAKDVIVEPKFSSNLMDFDLNKFGAPPPRARLTKDEQDNIEKRKAEKIRLKEMKEQSLQKAKESFSRNAYTPSPTGTVSPVPESTSQAAATEDEQPKKFELPDISKFQPPPPTQKPQQPQDASQEYNPPLKQQNSFSSQTQSSLPPRIPSRASTTTSSSISTGISSVPIQHNTSSYERAPHPEPLVVKKVPPTKPKKLNEEQLESIAKKKAPPPKPKKKLPVESSASGSHIRELQNRLGNLNLQ